MIDTMATKPATKPARSRPGRKPLAEDQDRLVRNSMWYWQVCRLGLDPNAVAKAERVHPKTVRLAIEQFKDWKRSMGITPMAALA